MRLPTRIRAALYLLTASSSLLAVGALPCAAKPTPREEAAYLNKWAREALAQDDIESRQRAIRLIKDAIDLEPDNSNHWLVLGRAQLVSTFDHESRDAFRQAAILDPGNKDAFFELGMFYKREWIRAQRYGSLMRAIGAFDTATALRPGASDAWLQLVPLYFSQDEFDAAAQAAGRSLAGRPRRIESRLAVAYTRHRLGAIEDADSIYRETIPLLEGEYRQMYDDPAKMMGAAPNSISLDELDPDPTTPENEVVLEFWSRITQAVLLFHDPVRPGLDARAETYIRYGPPVQIEKNPFGVPLFVRASDGLGEAPVADYPAHVVAWHYPELGMRVVLQDRSLLGTYTRETTRDFDPLSVPNPGVLKSRRDLLALGEGLAVFSRLPPVDLRLDVRTYLARFRGERGPRLFAQVDAAGGPADTLVARWVVRDPTGETVESASLRLAVSACDPTARRQAQFWADLPPGAYDVALSVRDRANRSGLYEKRMTLPGISDTLSLSDLVLVCGDPALVSTARPVRFDANVESNVSGSHPLGAYMEIYDMATDDAGNSHFEYTFEVRRAVMVDGERWEWGPAVIRSARQERHVGTMRRQFLSVPTQALSAGRYRLEVLVQDMLTGAITSRTAGFVKN